MKKLIKKIIICVAMSFLVVLMIYNFKTPKIAKAYDSKDCFSYFYDEPNHKLTFKKNDFSNDIDIGDYILYKVTKDNGSYFYVYDNIIDNQNIYDISFHDCLDLGIRDKFDDVYMKIIYLDNDKYDVFLSKIDSLKFDKLFTNAIDINFESDEGKKLIERAFYDEKAGLRDVDVPVCYDLNAYEEAKLLTDSDQGLEYYSQNTNTKKLDDDPITNFVPKQYFTWVGNHEYTGLMYKFMIETKAVSDNSQTMIKYASEVTIIRYSIIQSVESGDTLDGELQKTNFEVNFKYGWHGNYYCYLKNNDSNWKTYDFNPHKDSIVRTQGNVHRLEMKYFSNSFSLINQDGTLCKKSSIKTAEISINFKLSNLKFNYDYVDFMFYLIQKFDKYASAYFDTVEFVGNVLNMICSDDDLSDLYDLNKGVTIDNYINVKASNKSVMYKDDLTQKISILHDDQNYEMIVANGYDYNKIVNRFSLEDPSYCVRLCIAVQDYKNTQCYVDGRTYIITNDGIFFVDYDKIKVEYNNFDSVTENENTSFGDKDWYCFKYTISSDSILQIRTDINTLDIAFNNATWLKVYDQRYNLLYYFDGYSTNTTYYTGNASGIIKLSYNNGASNFYYIQTGFLKKTNINYKVLISEPETYTSLALSYTQNDNIKYFKYRYNDGQTRFRESFFNIGAISPTVNCETIFEIYSEDLIRKNYAIDGLWEDTGDDESNMNSYKENIKLNDGEYYYIKVAVSPKYRVFGNVRLEINHKETWQ